jgi:hypothetical protein
MRKVLSMTLALALASGSASALESATTGSQATQATVGAINSKVDTSIAALQAQITGFTHCSSIRKFYAPSDPKKDANGCVGVGDYDLNMASGSNVSLADGQVVGKASSGWSGNFQGASGIYGFGNNGYGLQAGSANTWAAVFTGVGSAGGVYIQNGNNNAQLCVNGSCTRALHDWGGEFSMISWYGGSPGCYTANPYTGGCSCPGGYNVTGHETGVEVHALFLQYTCYR